MKIFTKVQQILVLPSHFKSFDIISLFAQKHAQLPRIQKFKMKRRKSFPDDELENYVKSYADREISELKICLDTLIRQRNRINENLKNENGCLKSEISKLQASLESIKRDHEEYKASMVDKIEYFKQIYDGKFQLLQNDREALIQKLRSKVSKQTDEVIMLDIPQSKSQEARAIKRLKEKLSKRKEKLNMTIKRTGELSNLNIEKDKIIQVKSKNIEDLVIINKSYEEKNGDLLRKIEDLELNSVKIEMLQTKVEDQEVSLQNMARRNKAITAENEALVARLSYIESEQETITESQEKMIEDANIEITNLKFVENTLKEKLEKKCDELGDATEELEKIKQDLETKKLEIVSFKDQFNMTEAKNRELADQQEEFRTKNQFVIRENEDLKCDLRKQVEQNISTQTLLVKLKETLKRQEAEIQNLRCSSTSVKKRLTKTKHRGMEITLIDGDENSSNFSNENDNPLSSLHCKINPVVNIPHGIALETIID